MGESYPDGTNDWLKEAAPVTKLQVSRVDGVFSILDHSGTSRPIRLAGQPVHDFLPGWTPRAACDSFAPWTLLDLIHETGNQASWLLSGELEHWSVPLSGLGTDEHARIVEQAAPALGAIHQAMLCAAHPSRPPELALFEGLNRETVIEIVRLAASHAIGPTRVVDLYREAPDPAGIPARSAKGRPIRLNAVASCLDGNFQEALQAALHDGSLACASPVDGRLLHSRDSLVLHEHRIAYRFVDERHGLVFYVSTTNYLFAKADLFIPSINTVFMPHKDDRKLGTLALEFLAHVISDADLLLAYLGTGKPLPSSRLPMRRMAVVCRGYPDLHIGHQVWNELTAIDRLVAATPAALLPMVIVPNVAQGSEVYAPIDRIFPELEGRIDRDLHTPETLGEHVYRRGYCVFRALDEHVTQGLARRIRAAAAEDPPNRDDERLATRIRAENIPCILFGLRVENRTAINPGAVVADSIEHLRQRVGHILVILDGHNARLHHDPVSHYDSFGQNSHEPPIFAELRLVMQLRRRFENTNVEIVNLCGAAMSRSLFWTCRADFFVAFWGAGLAKYRWICNRPGLVLSSVYNLRLREDLDIYHAPRYHEDGAPLRFIDAAHVTDMPEAPVLFSPIPNPIPLYGNFRINHDGLLHELDGMIARHLHPGPPCPGPPHE